MSERPSINPEPGDYPPLWLHPHAPARQRYSTPRTPIGAFLCSWLEARLSLRPSTLASYRAHIERHLIPALGHVPMRELRPETIQRAYHELLADGMTPATLGRVHATLSVALNTAARQGLLAGNPLAGVELPRVEREQPTVWTHDEARAFLTAVRGDALEGLWRMALLTGMRRGELLGLRWADIDLDRALARVRASRITVGATTLEGPPKSRAGRRTVHLDQGTTGLLRDANPGRAQVYVFLDVPGRPLNPAWVSRRFTHITTDAGLPRIRFHDLRHTSATLGLASGESLKAVSHRLGHADISTTANTYAQVPDTTAARDAARLADQLKSPGGIGEGVA